MSEQALLVLRWIRYAEYVAAWETVPLVDRPRYSVKLIDGGWLPVKVV